MISVVTLSDAGRLEHVVRQSQALPANIRHIVVALGDEELLRQSLPQSIIYSLEEFSLAKARNLGGDLATQGDPNSEAMIVFLDADCLPGPHLFEFYRQALNTVPEAVVAGPVTYLPTGEIRTTAPSPHPARPNPPAGELMLADDRGYELFWSLSFALAAGTWRSLRQTFGGFDPEYIGYGGEDTDFGQNLRAHGVPLYWVGGAHAYHQWHAVSDPPWEHFSDILINAERFKNKWGFWPMEGWLEKFAAEGAVEFRDGRWVTTAPRT